MKVMITRTSGWSKKPCAGVKKEIFDHCEIRTCTEEYFNDKFSAREGLWRSKGFNHTTCKDGEHIKRFHKDADSGYFMTITDLEDLLDFVDKHGQCVICGTDANGAQLEIEIYDDYRE
jgi:hypothetical protein